MPDISSYSGYPVPLLSEAANLPAAMLSFRSAVEPHTVLFAVSVSDRNSKYGTAPAGTIVSVPSIPAIYQKLDDATNTWLTVAEDTGWQSFSPSVWEPNWSDVSSSWRRLNGSTFVNITATWTSDSVTASDTGNITDIPVMTLPSGVAPVYQRVVASFGASTPGSLVAFVAGEVIITHLYSNGTLSNGTVLTASLAYPR